LFDFAARHPDARTYSGRGASYAIPLPSGEQIVVRHNRHGGALASITGDLFRAPTRAPIELALSERLRSHGIPTPQVLGYVTYPAFPGFERADVATREIQNSGDLSSLLTSREPSARERALRATATLIKALADAGARHHDLNIKNVLLQAPTELAPRAFVLDVDRVTFGLERHAAIEANVTRLVRSARKWQRLHAATVTDDELDSFLSLVRDQ
jgi:hypothetical protein